MGMYGGMAAPGQPAERKQPQMPEVGPVGRNVIASVERICRERNLSMRKLSAWLEKAGHPIPPLGLARMMKAERRVDVDEASAMAEVLGVTVAELLADPGAVPAPDHAALRAGAELADRIGQLLAADGDGALSARRVGRALQRVQIEVEELLEQAKASA